MMDEIFSGCEMDELFLDIFGIQFHMFHPDVTLPFCFCKHTEAAWDKKHSGGRYRAGFNSREGLQARYGWHQRQTMSRVLDEITSIARKRRPQLLIFLDGGPESFPDDIMEKIRFIYAEPITALTGDLGGSIMVRGRNRPNYQAGIFRRQGYLDTHPGETTRVQAEDLAVPRG